MTIIASKLYEHINHALGGAPAIAPQEIVNAAGRALFTMHPWKFKEGRSALLALRAKVEATAATVASATITSTGSFTNYTFVDGDKIKITSGTGITTPDAEIYIRSRTDANTIVLESAPGGAGTDLAFTMENNTALLPSDCDQIIAYECTNSLTNILIASDHQEFLARRASEILGSTWGLVGVVTQHTSSSLAVTPGKLTRLLEIWPTQEANDVDAISIVYRAGWVQVASDTDRIGVPDFIEPLLVEMVRQYALGWEEEDKAPVWQRVAALMGSQFFIEKTRMDASIQPDYGEMIGGAAMRYTRADDDVLSSIVASPS